MRFATISAAVLGLVASVLAEVPFDPIYSPSSMQEVPAGVPFTITWTPQPAEVVNVPISITLIGGPAQALQVPLYTIVGKLRICLLSHLAYTRR